MSDVSRKSTRRVKQGSARLPGKPVSKSLKPSHGQASKPMGTISRKQIPIEPPEPDLEEIIVTEPLVDSEPLLEDNILDEKVPESLPADSGLISEESLYSQDDPLEAMRKRKNKVTLNKPKGLGIRTVPAKAHQENESMLPESQRSLSMDSKTKRSFHKVRPKATPLPMKSKVLGGIAVILMIASVIVFKPVMKMVHTQTLDDPASNLETRQIAIRSLIDDYAGHEDDVFQLFSKRLAPPDPILREAAAYGMELLGKPPHSSRKEALKRLGDELPTADAAGKLNYIHALSNIAQASAEDTESIGTIAALLIPEAENSQSVNINRMTAVESLSSLRAPGVCRLLLKIALAEKNDLGKKARGGIAATAMPDAVGSLLETITNPDAELATEAKRAFVLVRDNAKSAELLPLIEHPSDDVRREITGALGNRRNDPKATEGITRALKDKLPEIRLLAVKAIPVTGISGSVGQLAELVNDPDENVRLANADTLGQLGDSDSSRIVIEAFKNNLQGKTMEAYIRALGRRSHGKDLNAIGILMPLLDKYPASAGSICDALVCLTRADRGPQRDAERRGWKVEKWKSWHVNISAREKLRADAVEKLNALKKHRDDDKKTFQKLKDATGEQMQRLEKCREMCMPDDPEDGDALDKQLLHYSVLKEHFMKNASLDLSR